jgi:DNA modification methylase
MPRKETNPRTTEGQPRQAQAVEQVAVEALIPYARNARTHDDAQVAQIAASIREFGFNNPVLIDAAGTIIAGHGRVLAARKLGLPDVPCIRLSHLTESQKRAYILADNKLALNAGWDDALLAVELADLKLEGVDLALLGWDEKELSTLSAPAPTDVDAEPQIDKAEELRGKWGVETGQLWQLGDHRLLCGDSTLPEDVTRLMDGERAGLMNTDPPYGVSYANDDRPNPGVAKPRVAKPRVANDGLADEKLQQFLEACFRSAKDHALASNAAWYMWHAHLTQGYFAAAAAAAAVILHRQIIWVKPVLLLGRGQYHWKHEPCFMGWVEGHQPPDYGEGHGERTQTTVWEIASVTQAERKEFNHATPKPVGLFAIPIVKHLRPGEICFEPFSGSGPQLIAAEQLGRKCRAIEIDPGYVAVAIQRWADATGKTPVLLK